MSEQEEWDGSVDPNAEEHDSKGTKYCRTGKKVLAPLGFERFFSKKKTPMLAVRFICVNDMVERDDGEETDQGRHVWRQFSITRKAISYFARFARGMGHNSPFNAKDDDSVSEVLGAGLVIGTVAVSSGISEKTGKPWERSEVKYFDRFEGDDDPEWDEIIVAGEEEWDKYLKWREAHPRGQRKDSGGSGGSGDSGDSGGSGGSFGGSDDDMPYQNDDIPF